jgi:hypothetical protein
MDGFQEQRARALVNQLERSGINCGLFATQGTVVMRRPGAPCTDTPTMFDENVLQDAIALDLLEKQKMYLDGKFGWEWYISKRKPPKPGDWIIFSDGSRKTIDGMEKGLAFYGKGAGDLVPCVNLVPASNADPHCWEVDNTR